MTVETLTQLQIPIMPADDVACMYAECALGWINNNTSLKYDLNNLPESLPSNVRLFILKYNEAMSISAGVSSESIEGLSQSFSTGDKAALLWDIAASLLDKWLVSPVRFVAATNRWK